MKLSFLTIGFGDTLILIYFAQTLVFWSRPDEQPHSVGSPRTPLGGFEDGHRDLRHRELLMVGLLRGDHRSIGGQHEVDARIGHQIGLEPDKEVVC